MIRIIGMNNTYPPIDSDNLLEFESKNKEPHMMYLSGENCEGNHFELVLVPNDSFDILKCKHKNDPIEYRKYYIWTGVRFKKQ